MRGHLDDLPGAGSGHVAHLDGLAGIKLVHHQLQEWLIVPAVLAMADVTRAGVRRDNDAVLGQDRVHTICPPGGPIQLRFERELGS